MQPGGRCDTQKGLDCIGESHCFYGICVCLYGLVNIGNECASSEVLKKVAPDESCALGQKCEGRSRCIAGVCKCVDGETVDKEAKRCVNNPPPYQNELDEEDGLPHPEVVGIHLGKKPKVQIYNVPGASNDDGRFNQILTANQMSINVLDQVLLVLII